MTGPEIIAHSGPQAPDRNRRPDWWERRWFLAALVLASAIPLIYPDVPPLVDLFGHMGRYRVQLDIDHSAALQQFYAFHWAPIGNLGVDLLVEAFGPLFGLEPTVKAIVIAIPMLTVAGFLWVAYETHRRIPPTAFAALPFVYSFPFLFGFVNYALSMALAFLALGLWIRLGRKGRDGLRTLLFVPISFIVYFTHTFGWGMLGLICFSAESIRQHDSGMSWWKAGLVAARKALVMAGPALLVVLWRSNVGKARNSGWFDWDQKWLWVTSALRDRWEWLDRGLLAALAMLVLFAIVHRRLTLSRNLVFSALVLAIAFALLPWTLLSSAYADMRLVPYVLAVIVLAIRFKDDTPPRLASILAALGILAFAAKLAITTASLGIAASRQERQLAALDHVPVGARMLNFVGRPCAATWPLFRQSHLGAMAMVRREAFSNDQWAIEGTNLLSVELGGLGYFKSDPSQMVMSGRCPIMKAVPVDIALRGVPRGVVQYIWLIDVPPYDESALGGYRKVWSDAGAHLYARDPASATGTP